MNKKIFEENLIKSIEELKNLKSIDGDIYIFHIIPIAEKGKNLTAYDDFMRLNVLNINYIRDRTYTLDEVVTTLSHLSPLVPIWINLYLDYCDDDTLFIKLECSLRFRKPSLLRNQETGHAPFKVITHQSLY